MSDYLTHVMHTSDFVDRNEIETAYIVLYKTQPLLYHLYTYKHFSTMAI